LVWRGKAVQGSKEEPIRHLSAGPDRHSRNCGIYGKGQVSKDLTVRGVARSDDAWPGRVRRGEVEEV